MERGQQHRAPGGSTKHSALRLLAAAQRGRLVVAVLAGVLAARFWVIAVDSRLGRGPTGAGFGADFGMFEAAAKALTLGRNPYDHRTLYATEWALMHAQRLLITGHVGLVRVGNPPLFFWALQPLTHLSFQPVAVVWIFAMWALAGAGFFALLRYFGWRRKLLPCALFLATPQVLTGVVVGNVVPLVFAAVAGALCLVREYPAMAGVSLAAIWLKPQIGLPAVLLILAFHCDRPRRVLSGFAGGSAALLGLIVATTGWHSVADWVHGVQGYTESISSQVYVTSLASVYYQWASPMLRELLSALALCLAAALTLACWRRRRGARPPFADVAWLWFVWFLATPYAHIDDEMFLAIPLVALLGRDGVRIAEPVPGFATFLILFSAVRDPSWLPWELLTGAVLLLLPELRGQPAVPIRWKLGLFAVLFLSVVPSWGTYRVDAESIELLGAGLGAALLAIYGRPLTAMSGGPQASVEGADVAHPWTSLRAPLGRTYPGGTASASPRKPRISAPLSPSRVGGPPMPSDHHNAAAQKQHPAMPGLTETEIPSYIVRGGEES